MQGILEIAELGNDILRRKALDVENLDDQYIQSLIDGLIETAKYINGVGIAAPQVSESLRIFIMSSHPNPRYPNAPDMEPTEVINPRIVSYSKAMKKDWEGCLSIPGIRGYVPRHRSIDVKYLDRNGIEILATYEDFIARIFQHEYDHLDGILFLDRLDSIRDIITDKEYAKLMPETHKL